MWPAPVFLYGNGCHRVQIIYFFRWQIGPRTPSGIGLRSGDPVDRIRQRLGFSRELWIEIFGKSWSRAIERKGPCLYVCTDGSRRACGVGACARLLPTKSGPWETSGPRTGDSTGLTPLGRPGAPGREVAKTFTGRGDGVLVRGRTLEDHFHRGRPLKPRIERIQRQRQQRPRGGPVRIYSREVNADIKF